jgi:hypothetical protein
VQSYSTSFGWDKIFEFLRYPNSYYYLLSGEIKDIDFINRKKGLKNFVLMTNRPSSKIELKVIDVLVKVNNSLMLYRGLLKHYTLAADNKLDKLYLTATYRSKYQENCDSDHNFRKIPGAYFAIDGNDIVNINIEFYELYPKKTLSKPKSRINHILIKLYALTVSTLQ